MGYWLGSLTAFVIGLGAFIIHGGRLNPVGILLVLTLFIAGADRLVVRKWSGVLPLLGGVALVVMVLFDAFKH
ncbi:MAG: hypothetical protein IT290_08705 [Deltaproteobacteria bacterium]|nr:hypothetical protein [Deltaproteobacteria bacterium]